MIVVIACISIIFALIWFRPQKGYKNLLIELHNNNKSGFPAFPSNIEDVLMKSSNRVSLYKQNNKVAVLTGGNRGIGVYVLEKLLQCEMTVVLGVRNPEASKKSVESVISEEVTRGKLYYEKCDTGDLESVRNFARKVQEKFPAIHLLINNAGILFPPYEITKDGFESQMAVNYIGHFLLTHLLLPQLIKGSNDGTNSRIVNVSSCANECGSVNYDDFSYQKYYHAGLAYGDSKLAQILASNHLNMLCKEKGIKVQSHCAHPGVVDTDIFNTTPVWGSLKFLRRILFKTPEEGSRTIIHAAISPDLEGHGGEYFSNCRVKKTNPIADDEKECEKFFNFTCELLKINFLPENIK